MIIVSVVDTDEGTIWVDVNDGMEITDWMDEPLPPTEVLTEPLAEILPETLDDKLGTLAEMLGVILGDVLGVLPVILTKTLTKALPDMLRETLEEALDTLAGRLIGMFDERLGTPLLVALAEKLTKGETLADMLADTLGDIVGLPPETLAETPAEALGETFAVMLGELLGDRLEKLPVALAEALAEATAFNEAEVMVQSRPEHEAVKEGDPTALTMLPAPDPLALARLDVAEAVFIDTVAADDPPSSIDALTQSRPVHEVVDVADPKALAALLVLDALGEATPNVAEPELTEVARVDDPLSDIDARTQRRPVHEVVED